MRLVLAASSCLALAGCASMSKSECLYADWRAVGYEDGAAGAPATAVAARRQACARAGVTPNMGEYLAGRDVGLQEYCTAANGFSVGESGGAYSGVCGQHEEQAFLEQYRAGAHLYRLRDEVDSAHFALNQATGDLGSIKYAIAQTSITLVRPDLSVTERAAQVVELTHLSDEFERIERSIPALRSHVEAAEAELGSYQAQLASRSQVSRALVAAR